MGRHDQISEERAAFLVQSIWEAALSGDRWAAGLAELGRAFGANSAKAAVLDTATGAARLLASWNIDPAISARWQAGDGGRDLWAESGLRLARQGRVVGSGAQMVPVDVYRRSPIYHEVSRPSGHEDCLSTATGLHGGSIGFVSLYANELFEAADLETFEYFAAQLRSAMNLQARIVRRATARASLESIEGPALVCGADGAVQETNAEADRLLAEGDGITTSRGVLHARSREANDALHRAIGAAAPRAHRAALRGSVVRLPRSGRAPLGALAVPAPGQGDAGTLLEMTGGVGILVVLSDPELLPDPPTAPLERLFGLTRAEAELARALARGETLAAHAEAQEIARETARSRLKVVLKKTGARRQADLVRMVLTSVASRRGA